MRLGDEAQTEKVGIAGSKACLSFAPPGPAIIAMGTSAL